MFVLFFDWTDCLIIYCNIGAYCMYGLGLLLYGYDGM